MNQMMMKQQVSTVRDELERLRPQIEMALPAHATPDRLLRVVMTSVQQNPDLLECDRRSLFSAVMSCAQLGLEPDGVLGHAYLVPFKRVVQLIIGYKGLIHLARNSGQVKSIYAGIVHKNDEFHYEFGLNETLRHVPTMGDRGPVIRYYAYALFRDGGSAFESMSIPDVEAVRNASQAYRAFKAGKIRSTPWDEHFDPMAQKTCIRRIAKFLPMSVQRAAELDSAAERGYAANIGEFGELVIDNEAVEEDAAPAAIEDGRATATAQMDDFAGGDPGDAKKTVEAEKTEAKPAPKAETKKADRAQEQTPGPGDVRSEPKRQALAEADQLFGDDA